MRTSRIAGAGAVLCAAALLIGCSGSPGPAPTGTGLTTITPSSPPSASVDPVVPDTEDSSTEPTGTEPASTESGGDAGAATPAPPETHGVPEGGPHSVTIDGKPRDASFLAEATCVTDAQGILTVHAGAPQGQQGDSLTAVLESAGDGPAVSLSVGGDSFPLYGATQLKRDGETLTITGTATIGPRAQTVPVEIVVTCTV